MGLHKFTRRHHHEKCVIPAVPGARKIAGAALLLFTGLTILALLAPPPTEPPAALLRRHCPLIRNNHVTPQANALVAETFHVPNAAGNQEEDLWVSKLAKNFYSCSNASNGFAGAEQVTQENRYLVIETSGGLNQQRTGITDAVVAARILNATLVIPKLDQKSFWEDSSNFSEIFDVDWFISSLAKDVRIVKEIPGGGGKAATMRVPRKCTPKCYETKVLPALLKKHVVQLTKFDYRLSNKLDPDLQKLRCRVNYHALKFTDSIKKMGETLIKRMRQKKKKFIALHLRFEPDMLAFSGCYYGGGEKERSELGEIRKRWKTLHASNPDKERKHGKCPLTPEEVGLMLRALGFGSDVHIYVASGEVYGGEESLAPLKALFPNFHTKETLAGIEELAPFSLFSSRMAALDFIVCDASDVFVTNNNGNMARILAGRRRYFGHKRTIRPNAKKLYCVFTNRTSMEWETFASQIRTHQRGFMGEPNEVKPGTGEFHENPTTCICENREIISRISTKFGNTPRDNFPSSSMGGLEDHDVEPDSSESDYGDQVSQGKSFGSANELDYDLFFHSDEPELDELISD